MIIHKCYTVIRLVVELFRKLYPLKRFEPAWGICSKFYRRSNILCKSHNIWEFAILMSLPDRSRTFEKPIVYFRFISTTNQLTYISMKTQIITCIKCIRFGYQFYLVSAIQAIRPFARSYQTSLSILVHCTIRSPRFVNI